MSAPGLAPEFLVGDRVRLHRRALAEPARVLSLHRAGTGWEYVLWTDEDAGSPSRTVNVFTTAAGCTYRSGPGRPRQSRRLSAIGDERPEARG